MKSTIEIISILKRLKKDSAYKYGIKPFGYFWSHLLGINRMRQVIWMYLSLFRNLIFLLLEKIKEELEKLMHLQN